MVKLQDKIGASLENQIKLAEDLKSYLHRLQERLSQVSQSYRQKCDALFDAGMMSEPLQKLEQEYVQQTIQSIVQVVEQINNVDIPFVEKQIAKFAESRLMIRDLQGNIILKSQGDRIVDNDGNWLYGGSRNRGDRIYDENGEWKYEVRGDRIYDTSGNWLYEIRGNRIYDTSGNWLASDYESSL